MSSRHIPRYDRPIEAVVAVDVSPVVPIADLDEALEGSDLSDGARDVIRAVLRLAIPTVFPGGGVGLEYGPLLKTATRPDVLARHIAETANHLRAHEVDILVVPGMSGYPIGAMYSMASGIPALLLKKQTWLPDTTDDHPPGSFIIPSYTGNSDTVISADISGARDILAGIIRAQRRKSTDVGPVVHRIRIAGADEIIDKATMATAITENAPIFVRAVIEQVLAEEQWESTVKIECEVVAWVTPLMKEYGNADSVLARRFGIRPFAGATITAIQVEPPAIGFAGLGLVQLGEPI